MEIQDCIVIRKYRGLGSEYLVLDPNRNNIEITEHTVRKIFRRDFARNAEGLLVGPYLEDGKKKVRIFAPTGQELKVSGNGVRIFAKYLVDQQYVEERRFTITTLHAEMEVECLNRRGTDFKINMGKASFLSEDIPVRGRSREVINEPFEFDGQTYNVTCLSVGNPHCIIIMEEISRKLAEELGPHVDTHEDFPHRMNLQMCKIIDRADIEIEIHKRGRGYVKASGTGSIAAAAAAHRMGLVDSNVLVNQPAGVIEVEIGEDGSLYMIGNVKYMDDEVLEPGFFEE